MMRRLAWSLTVVAMLGIGTVWCGQDEPSFRPASIGEGRASAQDRQRPSRPAQEEGARIPQGIEEAGPTVTEVQAANPALLDPRRATERAPDQYTVELDTTEGPIQIEVHRAWAPNGADRFYNLVRIGYFTDVSFFRVVEGFMAQAGIHGRPDVNTAWRSACRGCDLPCVPCVGQAKGGWAGGSSHDVSANRRRRCCGRREWHCAAQQQPRCDSAVAAAA